MTRTEKGEDPLLRAFLERKPGALSRVKEAVAGVLRFRGHGIPSSERGDLLQETLMQIWREVSRPGFRFREDFLAFARLVAHRRCLDWQRSRRGVEPLDEGVLDRAPRPDEAALSSERAALADQVLGQLAAPCRDLIRLHVFEERSYREIAIMQERNEGAVRTQMWQCLKAARAILDRLVREPARPVDRRPS